MIRINLLGKKKSATIPFGLEDKLEKLGVSGSDLQELRPALVRHSASAHAAENPLPPGIP